MVKCDDSYSFRLALDESIYSNSGTMTSSYKRRIDSLFREKRTLEHTSRQFVTNADVHTSEKPSTHHIKESPQTSSSTPAFSTSIRVPSLQTWGKTPTPKEELERLFGGRNQRQQAFHDVRSAVQAQIERLFADATGEPNIVHGTRSQMPRIQTPVIPSSIPTPPPPPPKLGPLPPLPSHSPSPSAPASDSSNYSVVDSPTPCHVLASMNYRIDYLGSLQLSEKASSLEVLQEPLKELYYKYRLGISKGRKPLPGSFHITDNGIRITHGHKHEPGFYELLNPFPTIAVWAAVKLVIRREVGEHGQMFFSYAFLPLICDPEAQDKYNLYHELNVGNPNIMAGEHPPMFACVMRKVGVPKVLECHGFVCKSAEDAIVIAANLYQALLETMRLGDHTSDSSESRDEDRHIMSDSEIVPIRPPRRKRSRNIDSSFTRTGSRMLKRSSSEDFLRSQDIILNEHRLSKRRIKRSVSDRHSLATLEDSDNYTKSLMPRSKSFINVSSKYGFQDLLHDVKQKTGLNSVDDVLKQIINPRGMSFTEMDPKYRELLLKLALTLSKDEIYQRSKNIMRKHKYRTTSIASVIDSDSEGSTISSVIRATKRSFSRLGSRASSLHAPSIKESLSRKSSQINLHPPQNHLMKEKPRNHEKSQVEIAQVVNSFPSKRPVPKTPMPRRNEDRLGDGYNSCNECGYDSECSSKCYCSLPRRQTSNSYHDAKNNSSAINNNKNSIKNIPLHNNNNNTSNNNRMNNCHTHGVHKNEMHQANIDSACECDTESCTESEKCYCSLKRVKNCGAKMYEINLDSETDTNTDATIKSILTYGRNYETHSSSSNRHRTSSPYLTEHSKSRSAGTVFSVDPDQIRKKSLSSNFSSDSDTSDMHRSSGCSSASGYHSQGSIARGAYPRSKSASNEFLSETLKHRRHRSTSLAGSLASRDSHGSSHRSSLGSLMDKGSHRSRSSSESQQKILLVSAVDPSGKVVYRGASQKQRSEGSDTNSIMSMKKTAEIAALFSELKLNQTTDLINDTHNTTSESEDDAYSSLQANNSFLFSENIENSLGYLP